MTRPPAMSPLLGRYVAAAAFRSFVLSAASLCGLLSLLEFVEQLASVGHGSYGTRDALAYVALTAPGRLLQVMPVSALLASLLSLGSLSRTSELTAMLTLGISARRIVGTVLRLLVPIVLALLLLAEFVVPPAQQAAQNLRADALGPSAQDDDGVWAHEGREYLDVARFEHGTRPLGIDIYTLAPDGSLETLVHAERGDIHPDGTWSLSDVSRRTVDAARFTTEHLPRLDWRSFVRPGQLPLLTLPPDSLAPSALVRHIRTLHKRHQNATRFERALWSRAAIPVSMAAMAMIAAPLVFGAPRMQAGPRLARGVGLGIVFTLAQQIVGRLGELLSLGPAITALAPALLLLAVAVALLPETGGRRGRQARPATLHPMRQDADPAKNSPLETNT